MITIEKAQWLDARKEYIGGSDCAAVLGLSKWKTPYQLYLEKIGEAPPQDETWEMGRGTALEPPLRQHYADTTGRNVLLPERTMKHHKYDFIGYNPDGITEGGRLVEFKTAAYGQGWGEEGSDEIPQEYILQVQQGMLVSRLEVTDVTVSIAGNKPKYFIVEADLEIHEIIIEAEVKFWENVQNRAAPDPSINADVAHKFNRVNGQSIAATAHIAGLVFDLQRAKENIGVYYATKEKLEVEIKNFMGENESLIDSSGKPMTTWKLAKGAERLDRDGLKKAHPDIEKIFTKTGEPSRRFLVK